jgi:hypothetical protein
MKNQLLFSLLLGPMVAVGPAFAQVSGPLNRIDGTFVNLSGPFSISAEGCKQAQQNFSVPIDPTTLDTTHVVGSWPPGIEVQIANAFGVANIANVVLGTNALTFSLTAQGDGTIVPPPSGSTTGPECVGAKTAHIEVSVVAFKLAVTASATAYRAPKPDIRLVFDAGLLKKAVSGFLNYKLGEWIRLGEYGCGDRTMFDVHLKDPAPLLTTRGFLNPDGSYGTTLGLVATARAQVHGCLFDPLADGQASLGTTVGQYNGGALPVSGGININLGNIFNRYFPLVFQVPIPSLPSLPIDLPPVTGATLEFGTFDGNTFTPAPQPTHKDVPFTINIASYGESFTSNGVLVIDATVGQPQTAVLTNAADSKAYYTSDTPLWNQNNLGVTVHDSFFGQAGNAKPSTGLLGSLFPIRVKGNTIGSFKKSFEIVFDGASIQFVQHEGADALQVTLTTTYAKIGNGKPILGHGKPINKIQASILLDRIQATNGKLNFRVADFRIKIRTWFFIFPIKLSSGQLQQALNNGQIPLTGNVNLPLSLPNCINTNFDKFISTPGTCNTQPLIGFLGHFSGPMTATFNLDPTTILLRFNHFELSGQKWQGLQASGRVQIIQ